MSRFYDEDEMRDVREELDAELLGWPLTSTRKMMGCPCYMAGGRMFATIVTGAVVLTKLQDADREALMADHEAVPFEAAGKRMTRWTQVPVERVEDLEALRPFLKRSYEAALDESG